MSEPTPQSTLLFVPPVTLSVQTAAVTRPLSPGATRVIISARDDNDDPAAIFLCAIEPPDAFSQSMRESFVTICSVEDMTEYPVGVSSIEEVPPGDYEAGTFLYAAQENKVYIRSITDGIDSPVWQAYNPPHHRPKPNVHTNKLPFFRRSTIDVILPNRAFVMDAITWINDAVKRLAKDQADLERLSNFNG
jgi:hypothetical protein